jgi:hypothetical protein
MKLFFIFLLIIPGIKANSQPHPWISGTQTLPEIKWIVIAYKGEKALTINKMESDTIEINLPLKIHFIKIGTQVYQIIEHDPTIEFVKPFPGIQFFTDTFQHIPMIPTTSNKNFENHYVHP